MCIIIRALREQTETVALENKGADQHVHLHSLVSAFEPQHEISINVVCATSQASDQPAHTRSLTRAFANRLNIL